MPIKVDANNENMAGLYCLSAKSEYRPRVLDKHMQPILDETTPSDGDGCHFSIRLFAYTKGKRGVGVALNGIMFDKKGDKALGKTAGPSDEQMFGHVAEKNPNAGVPNPF